MVFPSRGCRTCKKRHVKCDGILPTCGRCQKASRECVWDPNDQAGLHFKSENVFAGGRPRRPRKGREPDAEVSIVEPMALVQSPPSSPGLPKPLSIPLEMHALYFWVENYALQIHDQPGIGHEYMTYVLDYWTNADSDSSLHLALRALSHACFGRARHVTLAIEDADKVYAQSIMKTHREMAELSNAKIDQLLLAIMLMAFYENIMFGRKRFFTEDASSSSRQDEIGSRFWKTVNHHKGAIGLLKLRRERGLAPNLPLDTVVRRQVIRTSILRGDDIPGFLQNGREYGEKGLVLAADTLMIRVAALRAKSMYLFSPIGFLTDMQNIRDIATEAGELDFSIDLWGRNLPKDWRYATNPFSGCGGMRFRRPPNMAYKGPVHTYTSHGHAAVWNRVRAMRLITNSIRARALSALPQSFPEDPAIAAQLDTCQETITSTTNDLCGSVAFFYTMPTLATQGEVPSYVGPEGNYGEFFIPLMQPKLVVLFAWPLAVAVCTDGVPEPLRQWLKRKVKMAAYHAGDAILESVVERQEFRF